jgi:phytanoyl-CoA hydroxylase
VALAVRAEKDTSVNAVTSAVGAQRASNPQVTAAEHYATHGYAVVKDLVPKSQIRDLLTLYQRDIVPSGYPFFRQNSNAYEANKLTTRGYVRQSFLDIHDYREFSQFSHAARDIYCSQAMMSALRRVAGFDRFALMQTMLFDLNTETPGHQDWYYLDTVPSGNLIAAWIALEDIDERAGRFYVAPGSHKIDFGAKSSGRTHAQWLSIIRDYLDSHRENISVPALFAGDVLFWNSRTVHGSLATQDESYSRKSLTAHYLPGGFEFGNVFATKANIPYKDHLGIPYYRNQPDFSRWNRVKFAIKTGAYNYPVVREALRAARKAIARRR